MFRLSLWTFFCLLLLSFPVRVTRKTRFSNPSGRWLPQNLPDIIGLPFQKGTRLERTRPLRRLGCHQMALVRLVVANLAGSTDKESLARCAFDLQFLSRCHNISFRWRARNPGFFTDFPVRPRQIFPHRPFRSFRQIRRAPASSSCWNLPSVEELPGQPTLRSPR